MGGQENFGSTKAAAVDRFPTAMTVCQMQAWLISQGVQVGKVKMAAGGIDIDPKMDKHTQLLLPLHGKHFCGDAHSHCRYSG